MTLAPRFQGKHNWKPYDDATKHMSEAIRRFAQTNMELHERADLTAERRSYLLSKAKAETQAAINESQAALRTAVAKDRDSAKYRPNVVNDQNAAVHTFWASKAKQDMDGLRPDEALTVLQRSLDSAPIEGRQYYLDAAETALKGADMHVQDQYGALRRTHMSDNERWNRGLNAAADHVDYRMGYLDWHTKNLMQQAENHRQPQFQDAPQFFDTSLLSMWLDGTQKGAAADAEKAVAKTYEGTTADESAA